MDWSAPTPGSLAHKRLLVAALLLTAAASEGAAAAAVDRGRLCALQRGDWCTRFVDQAPQPYKPPPRGDRSCPGDCGNVGNCNHDTGARLASVCECVSVCVWVGG